MMSFSDLVAYATTKEGDSDYKFDIYPLHFERAGGDLLSNIVNWVDHGTARDVIDLYVAGAVGLPPAVSRRFINIGKQALLIDGEGRHQRDLLPHNYDEAPDQWVPCRVAVERKTYIGGGGVGLRIYPNKVNADIELATPNAQCWIVVAVLWLYWRTAQNVNWRRDCPREQDFVRGTQCWEDGTCEYRLDWGRPLEAIGPVPFSETW